MGLPYDARGNGWGRLQISIYHVRSPSKTDLKINNSTDRRENQYEFPDSPPMSERHGTSQTPSASSNNSGKEVKSRKKYRERQPVSQQEKDRKRTAFLERNRVAAGKCRSRKKDLVGQLEQDVRKAQTLNTALKAEHLVLLGEVNALRALAATCDDECKAAKEPVKVEAPTRTET